MSESKLETWQSQKVWIRVSVFHAKTGKKIGAFYKSQEKKEEPVNREKFIKLGLIQSNLGIYIKGTHYAETN